MRELMKSALKSKRVWVIAITMTIHLLAKYHVVMSDTQINDLAMNCIDAVGAAGIVVTKLLDARKTAA